MIEIEVRKYQHNAILAYVELQPTLISKIKEARKGENKMKLYSKLLRKEKILSLWSKKMKCYGTDIDYVFQKEIKKEIMTKARATPYTSHPNSTKMY